uniref:RNA polymerase II associated protein 1 n=1 Tax=Sphenodon punctatus TaxID=8508 RepID=A0A8D0G6X2_SPHPU
MLSRPKPGESEADLLQFQNRFLATKASPAVKIVKKADKRKGDGGSEEDERLPLQDSRDMVMLEDFPDVPPALIPAPAKKSKFKSARVHFEDPEEQLEHHDQHITAVLSKIVERDTSTATVTMPNPTGEPFPRAFHRSEVKSGLESGRKSIFAQKIAAKKAAEETVRVPPAVETRQVYTEAAPGTICLPGSSEGRQPHSTKEAQNIHEENMERLHSMSQEEILQEQKKLLAQLGRNTRILKSILEKGWACAKEPQWPFCICATAVSSQRSEKKACQSLADDLPVKPEKEWIHMDSVEFDKLKWMKDLPQPRRRRTKKGMQARFSLKGELIPPDADLPTHLGLHHHGEEAERAGYSLQELFHLSGSQVIQQRTLALQVLGHVVQKAKAGEFVSSLKGSVLHLLLDAGFLFLLRFSLDETVENVVAAAVHSLHALLVSSDDESKGIKVPGSPRLTLYF